MSTHAKPLWPIASLQIRRLGDDRHVRAPLAHERLGAEAHVLLVDDGRDDEPPARPVLREDAGGRDHRGDAALHVLRAAAVEPAVLDARREWIRHALDADGVEVAAEHHRRARPAVPSSTPIAFGRPGAASCITTSRPAAAMAARATSAAAGLTRCARHERRVHGICGDQIGQ